MEQTSPFCFACCYELTGLNLPHLCPECGRLADPASDTEDARKWFASPRAWRWCFTRPSRIPPSICYVLHDAPSARIARRRIVAGLFLPAILSSVLVLASSFIAIEYDWKLWYYNKSDPNRKPLRTLTGHETDELFTLNLHFFDDFLFTPPASWHRVKERTWKGLSLRLPRGIDPIVIVWTIIPWALLIFGFGLCRLIALTYARIVSARQDDVLLFRSIKVASTLVTLPASVALWAWFAVIAGVGVIEAFAFSESWATLPEAVFALAVICWLLSGLLGWPLLIACDRAHVLRGWRGTAATVLAATSVGGPAVAIWAMARWLS